MLQGITTPTCKVKWVHHGRHLKYAVDGMLLIVCHSFATFCEEGVQITHVIIGEILRRPTQVPEEIDQEQRDL